jgi:L-seryl-tRNA(Ser) seleniumtransferase
LSEVVAVARRAQVPVLVDAAAELPPASNLRRFIDEGADLVVFSGGKGIGGPAATGILCGRRSLVGAALLQQLDLDYVYTDWNPPANLIDKRDLPGVPRHGIGRPCKVGKEQIVGLLTALQRFCATDDAERNREFARITGVLLREIPAAKGFSVRAIHDAAHGDMPLVEVTVSGALTAVETAARLRATTPAIHVDATQADNGRLILVPTCLTVQDAAVIGGAFARIAAR